MEKKFCPYCNCRVLHRHANFCMKCGHLVEKQFNEPMMWLGWETY